MNLNFLYHYCRIKHVNICDITQCLVHNKISVNDKIIFSHCTVDNIWRLHSAFSYFVLSLWPIQRHAPSFCLSLFFPFVLSLSHSFTHIHTNIRSISNPMILKFLFLVSNMFYLSAFGSQSVYMSDY